MEVFGIHAILYLIIAYTFDICDSKCEEYVIILKEVSCSGKHTLEPIGINEINWSQLSYPYNSTDVYNEIYGYIGCLLEFDCRSPDLASSCLENSKITNQTHLLIPSTLPDKNATTEVLECNTVNYTYGCQSNNSNHTMTQEIDKSTYDVNITYINDSVMRNNSKFISKKIKTFTTDNHVVYCDYAEFVCADAKNHNVDDVEKNKYINSQNETSQTLEITLKRDKNSTIQPIFTNFVPSNFTDINSTDSNVPKDINPPFEQFKTVTLVCKFIENSKCERNIKSSTIQEISSKPKYHLNVYFKSNYIKNNTSIKYANCTKDLNSRDNYSLNLECESTELDDHIRKGLFPLDKNNNTSYTTQISPAIKTELNNLIFIYCQIIELNHTYDDYSIMRLNKCFNSRNINSTNKHADPITTIEDKQQFFNNTMIRSDVEFNETKIYDRNTVINEVNLSRAKEENIIKMHFITKNRNNCSENLLLSMTEGIIISLGTNNINKKLLESNVVEFKLSNCIKDNSSIKIEEVELAVVLSNGTICLNKLIDANEEPFDKQSIILLCIYLHLHKNHTILECEFIDLDDYKTADFKNTTTFKYIFDSSKNISQVKFPKEKITDDCIKDNHNTTKVDSIVNLPKNCTSNYTEKCMTQGCNSVELNESINNHTRKENNTKFIDSEEKNYTGGENKSQRYGNRTGPGPKSLAFESYDTEKILLIVIPSIAGASLLMVLAIKKWSREEQYAPAAVEEPDEDTAL